MYTFAFILVWVTPGLCLIAINVSLEIDLIGVGFTLPLNPSRTFWGLRLRRGVFSRTFG